MELLHGHLLAASSHGQVLDVAALLQDTTPTAPGLCHGPLWEHRARWKAPFSVRRRLLRVKACAHVSYKQTLRPPPTTVPAELGGISSAHHSHATLSHHTPPRRLHHVPQSTGMGWRRGALHGHARSHPVPEGWLCQQPYLVTWHTPSFPLLCRDGDRCSEQSSTDPLSSGAPSPCP